MESELELNDILQQMHVIATVPDLYHVLVELNTVRSLLQLLSHENTGMSSEEALGQVVKVFDVASGGGRFIFQFWQ